MVNQVQDAVRK